MRIHTVKEGDTIWKIARQYSTPPAKIIENNALSEPDRLFPGQKLMVFTPTRSYTVRGGDTLEKIAMRFGTEKSALLANNPALMGSDKIYPGQILAIKYDAPKYGSGLANGYYYGSCPKERLMQALPYLTYLTISGAKWDRGALRKLMRYEDALRASREAGKIPILRVFTTENAESLSESADAFTESVISVLKNEGFGGISLAAYSAMQNEKLCCDFLMQLKRALMTSDLELHLELDGNNDIRAFRKFSDIADVSTLNYQKGGMRYQPSFEEGECRLLMNYAEIAECQKTLLDLPSFAYANGEEIEIREAEKIARKSGANPKYDENTKMCSFSCNRYSAGKRESVTICYEAPENINAKLDLVGELGYMGISFDIMRVPTEYLMLFHTSFHTGIGRLGMAHGSCGD